MEVPAKISAEFSTRFSTKYVALGDSFTEGMGDDDARLPHGCRGWADRVAEQLARADADADADADATATATADANQGPGLGYANLAIRGKKLRQVLSEQIDAAVALEPTLISIYAGANDILRPRVDIDALVEDYSRGIAKLSATGATVLLFTGFDSKASGVFGKTRGRTAIYNELVREIADEHDALLVDYWRFDEYDDARMWSIDRMHMSTAGHINMARRVLSLLERESGLDVPDLQPLPALSRLKVAAANAQWAREYVGPWIGRRLRGVSSGDSLEPRWPRLHSPARATVGEGNLGTGDLADSPDRGASCQYARQMIPACLI
ncbi:SGNH/GDSL hydrolase family protein [Arthrobacter sp. H14-L1]|uniref:SGNH/GDSL hydrolase family protein n=1 Tax=Arthrobacter sp. H14-L1 TaxID=2996697 RepID=UPI00226FC11E|nr:SGNH/GDSL hydrolase family protein [Arthrobacter sp. H14-L1]MCY0904973.1 SGNH/GDSL hydrolase family protein [Arthrobacter sp. H14-L1]